MASFQAKSNAVEAGKREAVLTIAALGAVYVQPGGDVPVLNDVSLEVYTGESVGIIGESGSGKTTILDCVLGLLHAKNGTIVRGRIMFNGTVLADRPRPPVGKQLTYIPQDPASAFDPLCCIATNFREIIRRQYGGQLGRRREHELMRQTLRQVHLNDDPGVLLAYPHQLSGGMKQRLLIALALITGPQLIVADEPTSNLDCLTERAIVDLLVEIRAQHSVAFLMATHNIRMAEYFFDRIYILYRGVIVEWGTTSEIFSTPQHPYTRMLMATHTVLTNGGEPPGAACSSIWRETNAGCPYAGPCAAATGRCSSIPSLKRLSGTHFVRCHEVHDER